MSKATTVVEVKDFVIVKKIMAVLGLDDAGKIRKFFTQEIKANNEFIDSLKLNIQVAELKRKQEESKLAREIEDAEDKVESAYEAVTPGDVSSNAKMTSFSAEYWANIKSAETELEFIQKRVDKAKEIFEDKIKDYNKQIAKRKARIAKINKKA